MTHHRLTRSAIWVPACLFVFLCVSFYADAETPSPDIDEIRAFEGDYRLSEAVMCERIKGSTPIHRTVVFAASKGRAFCYNVFDPVKSKTHIYHVWYYRDEVVSRKRLILKPHRWETYSYHRIGSKAKGPWRVEITDADGKVIADLRFSVTD